MKELLKIAAVPLGFAVALALAAIPVLYALLQTVPTFDQSSLIAQISILAGGIVVLCCTVIAVAWVTLRWLRLYFDPPIHKDQVYAEVYYQVTCQLAWDEEIMRRAARNTANAVPAMPHRMPAPLPADTDTAPSLPAPEAAAPRNKLVYVPFPTTHAEPPD